MTIARRLFLYGVLVGCLLSVVLWGSTFVPTQKSIQEPFVGFLVATHSSDDGDLEVVFQSSSGEIKAFYVDDTETMPELLEGALYKVLASHPELGRDMQASVILLDSTMSKQRHIK